jgi:AAT family amino acid transporter
MQKDAAVNQDGTKRAFSNRHIQMIAIGGTIGTGLFLGSGNSISKAGPSLLIIYAVLGFFFFMMMRALGEMLYSDPEQHTFVAFITKYIGQAAGTFAGWSYWIGVVFFGMAELTAISTYFSYWFPHINQSLVQVVFLIGLSSLNLIAARIFGEAEFWFAMIKIIAIISMIIVGIVMVTTGFKTPEGDIASFGNIFAKFEFFPHGVGTFVSAFPMVFFAFQGMEFISITIGETKNPRQVLKKAINQTIYRIMIFYLGAIAIIMSVIPWHNIDPGKSPFVQVFSYAGLPAAAAVVNFVVLTSASSALNSTIFSAGRHFYQLACETNIDRLKPFSKISRMGVPSRGIILSAACMLIAPIITAIPAISSAFVFVTSVSSDMYIIVYAMSLYAHRKYRQSKDFMPDGFKMPGYRFTSPLTIAFFALIFITLFFNSSSIYPAAGAVIWTVVFGLITHYKVGEPSLEI